MRGRPIRIVEYRGHVLTEYEEQPAGGLAAPRATFWEIAPRTEDVEQAVERAPSLEAAKEVVDRRVD